MQINEFQLNDFLSSKNKKTNNIEEDNKKELLRRFDEVCDIVKKVFDDEWDKSDDTAKARLLEQQKGAIIGYEKDTNIYKDKIRTILREKNLLSESFPKWYPNLEEAVFSELYGLSGLAPWAYDMTEEYKGSSSAKLIGERLFCLIDGKSVLQEQRIPQKRREQLKRALLLATPKERIESGFHEVYLHNGIRITIFAGDRTKPNQDVIVFRKYVLKDLSFEKLASFGTFPYEAIPLFKAMIGIGFNVIMAGQVRSGKTTFLQTWQKYEDPTLEGIAIATDPETPWHEIMPENCPLMQLVVEDKDLAGLTKSILRGDQDYVILEEMRNGPAFNMMLDAVSTGTTRSKGTIHDNKALNIPYKMASKIRATIGGDENAIMAQCFSNLNYIIELYQVPENKARKRVKSIVEFRYDPVNDFASTHTICEYNALEDKWYWKYDIGEDKLKLAIGYEDHLKVFQDTLKSLAEENPLTGETVVYPAYYKNNANRNKQEE